MLIMVLKFPDRTRAEAFYEILRRKDFLAGDWQCFRFESEVIDVSTAYARVHFELKRRGEVIQGIDPKTMEAINDAAERQFGSIFDFRYVGTERNPLTRSLPQFCA